MKKNKTKYEYSYAGPDHDGEIIVEVPSPDSDELYFTRADLEAMLAMFGGEGEPAAWLHTFDNTEGCNDATPHRTASLRQTSPYGEPGLDFSEEFTVTTEPLYLHKRGTTP
jgi:hypothetical protein